MTRRTTAWAVTVDDDGFTYEANSRADAIDQAGEHHCAEMVSDGEGPGRVEVTLYTDAVWVDRPQDGATEEEEADWEQWGAGIEHEAMMISYSTRETAEIFVDFDGWHEVTRE